MMFNWFTGFSHFRGSVEIREPTPFPCVLKGRENLFGLKYLGAVIGEKI